MSAHRREADPSPPADPAGSTLDEVTNEILPALIARLRSSRLGELEVRTDDWRVRLRRGAGGQRPPAPDRAAPAAITALELEHVGVARSPAVGYFSALSGLAVGRSVQTGDRLGSVDVLGIAHDVAAPLDGVVSRVLAETGQAVEYGQALAEIDSLGPDPEAGEDGPSDEAADGGLADAALAPGANGPPNGDIG